MTILRKAVSIHGNFGGDGQMSTRDAVIEMIKRMPESSSIPEIIAELYVRQKVDEGLRQLDEGQGIGHDDVKREFSRWLA